MNDKAMRFRVGVFVLASLILLGVLVTLFGGFPSFFHHRNQFTIAFDSAPGVGPGTPVRRSGVRIGEVQRVRLDDETSKVFVDILVDQQYTIRTNDIPVLSQSVLGGDTTIDFVARMPEDGPMEDGATQEEPAQAPPEKAPEDPKQSAKPVKPGTVIIGRNQPTVQMLLNQTADVMPTTKEALEDIRRSLRRFERMTPLLEESIREYRDLARTTRELVPELRRTNSEILVTSRNWGRLAERLDVLVQTNQDKLTKTLDNLNDTLVRVSSVFTEENQKNLTATLKNVRAGSENLESMTKNADEMLKEGKTTIKGVNEAVQKADAALANLQKATKPLAERSDSVMRNLDEATLKLNRMADDWRGLFTQVQGLFAGQGSFRSLMTDPTLYNNLNDAACMLTRILPRVDRVIKDMEIFADKLARHPESLGLGGAIRPSSGLK